MVRISTRVIIVGILICFGAGVGIGYGIKAKDANALNSDKNELEAQIVSLNASIEQLQDDIDNAKLDLETKDSEYDALVQTHDGLSEELQLIQAQYDAIYPKLAAAEVDYQKLEDDYENLEEACSSATVSEVLRLMGEVSSLEKSNTSLIIEISRLNQLLAPFPNNALDPDDVLGQEKFRSPQWRDRDYELQLKLMEIGQLYNSTHTYVPGQPGEPGEFDCNDMAVDLWNMLLTEGIKSVIVVGNRDKVGETLTESEHAWLWVFNGNGKVIYLEPTTGEIMYGKLANGLNNPEVEPYRDGFIYEWPSDLRKDVKLENW